LNAPLLDRALELRRDIATLLGYKSWADHVTEVKMVKSGDNIKKVCLMCFGLAMPLSSLS
jgi:metallopeptidase MepB